MNISLSHIWKDKHLIYLIFLCLTTCLPQSVHAQKELSTLVLTFTDIRSSSGNILVAIYSEESQWSDHPAISLHFSKENMENGTFTVSIDSLERRSYAIALMDDEDGDNQMKYFCGIPREGFGMSTNPSFMKLRKPKFDAVSIAIDSMKNHMMIKLNYINPNKKIKEN